MLAEDHPDDASIDETYGALNGQAYRAGIEDTAHLTFSDLPLVVEHFLGEGVIPELLGTLDPARAVDHERVHARVRPGARARRRGPAARRPLAGVPGGDLREAALTPGAGSRARPSPRPARRSRPAPPASRPPVHAPRPPVHAPRAARPRAAPRPPAPSSPRRSGRLKMSLPDVRGTPTSWRCRVGPRRSPPSSSPWRGSC